MDTTILWIVLFGIALCGAVLFAVAVYSGALRQAQEVDPKGSGIAVPCSDGCKHMLNVPSMSYLTAMSNHVERRRSALAALLKDSATAEEDEWAAKTKKERLDLLRQQAEEVYVAVAAYVSRQRPLLHDLCPELTEGGLEKLSTSAPAMATFSRTLCTGGWPAPLGPQMGQINAAVLEHLKAETSSKQECSHRLSFLALFRRSCLLAFALATNEAIGRGAGARQKQRAEARAAFWWQLIRGGARWALLAIAFRVVPDLIGQAGEWVAGESGEF